MNECLQAQLSMMMTTTSPPATTTPKDIATTNSHLTATLQEMTEHTLDWHLMLQLMTMMATPPNHC